MSTAIINSIINIIYPPVCAGCNKPNYNNIINNYICNECFYGIKRHIPPFCLKCGRSLSQIKSINKGACAACAERQYYFDEAWSVCKYEGTIKDLIHKFKYSQKIQYKEIFQNLFEEFLGAFNILKDIDFIIPIPLHPTRLREREYNQSQILSSLISGIIHKPVVSDILARRRNTKSQIELDEKTRIRNIADCFAIKKSHWLKSKSVLLVDDVLTTGITLSEAAKTIKALNPYKISILTLAS
ncbi:MAG: ComF family protein [Candidatus Omnitrophota bacterium]